mgnify:CR=1 FL=1
MIGKEQLKEAYIKAIEKKLEKAKASYEMAKNDTIEAEGRMVTRYDSSKTETAWLADGCLREVKELEKYINNLRNNKAFANISDTVFADLIKNNEYQKTEKIVLLKTKEISNVFIDAFLGSTVGDMVVVEKDRKYFEYQIKKLEKGCCKDIVSIGSVVTLLDEFGEKEIYYIVNYIGGMDIIVEEKNLFCISHQTPLAKMLLGKSKGDKVIVSENTGAEMFIVDLE